MPSVRSAPLPTRVLLPSVAVAIVYALAGWAALLFVAPPLYAPAIFPAAGIGLVAVLVYGARVAPAIALASALVHLTAQLQPGAAGTPQPAVALAIACGAALQALAGAVLVRRSVGGPLTLDTPRAVARFFCFGALLACVVGATLGTLALWLGGGLPSVEFARTWATWWAGDALGVTVAAPIALCLVGEPREAWWPRLRSVALPLAVGLVLLGLATSQVSRWQEQRVLARFERDADGVSRSVDLRLRAHLDALDALHGVYVASHDVDRIEFRRAAEPWLRKLPSLKAMGWHERLPRSALPGFEAAVRAEGDASFRVFDRDPSLTPGDDELIAMRYVEPRAGNETAVGVNALSIPASRQAVEAARRGRAAVATAPFRLTQEPGDQMGVVVYRAVRGPDDGALRGLVFVTLRMEDTLAALRAVVGPAYRAVDHDAHLLAGLLGQPERGGGHRRAAAARGLDRLARGRDRERVDAHGRLVAGARLDVAHRDHLVVAGRERRVAVEHAEAGVALGAHRRLEARQGAARDALVPAHGLDARQLAQPRFGGAPELGAVDVARGDVDAVQRVQRVEVGAQPQVDAAVHAVGVALEAGEHALLLPAAHLRGGEAQQDQADGERQGDRAQARPPGLARLSDQAQRDRCGDRHAEGVAGPPGGPGAGELGRGHVAAEPQRQRADGGADHASQQRAEAEEARHRARRVERQRAAHRAPHEDRAGERLQRRPAGEGERDGRLRRAHRPGLQRGGEVHQRAAKRDGRRHARAVDQHGDEPDAGGREDRRRVERRRDEQQRGPARQRIGERHRHGGQQHAGRQRRGSD